MPSQHGQVSQSATYSPETHDRRRGQRHDDDQQERPRPWWRRPTELTAALALMGIIGGAANAVGFHFLPATQAVAAETEARAKADTALAHRVDTLAGQVKDLSDRLLFTNYMQCMSFKQTTNGPLPSECTTIIQRRLSP